MNAMQGKRVLIVEDDLELLDLLQLLFARMGAWVYTATDGQAGLQQFHAHQPDLVLLDLMMPDIDGWEVCQKIRDLCKVPIIILTALAQEADIVRGFECGADDYVTKPFDSDILLARVRAALRRAANASNGETLSLWS
jgi:DNA-binding response OmpR family regulator